ncbi:MAG: acyltransferase family protein [Polyangiales bacterium]
MALPAFLRLHLLDDRFPGLHGARAIAVVLVLQVHASNLLMLRFHQPDRPLYFASRSLWFGMDVFFILSGFLIGTMLSKGDAIESARGIGRFYLRRGFRIFPLYYLVLTILALLPITQAIQRATLFWEYAYATNYIVFNHRLLVMPWAWSLCVEEHFYLAVPLVLLLLRRMSTEKRRFGALFALWALGGAIRIVDGLVHYNPRDPDGPFLRLFVRTHDRFDILVIGVAIALAYRNHRDAFEAALSRPSVRYGLGVLGLIGLWLCVSPPLALATIPTLRESLSWGTFTSVLCGALLPLIIAGDGAFKRALSAPFFRPISTLSYGIYLIHIPVGEHLALPLAVSTGLGPGTTWLLSVFLLWGFSLAGAYLLHLLVEKPMLSLRDRVAPSSA